ncbi:MAG TPA: magnesium-translocating P-type ATPase [Gemmatimonadales bacterium]|nr:magnesium-translocating P-type ATPase [Gemmatimonadales bacterium]
MPGLSPAPEFPDHASPQGLTRAEAARRLISDGPNALPAEGERPWFRILSSQIATPLVLILIVAALLARLLREQVEAIVILLIVALNALLGFVQEYRAERSLRALRRFLTHFARARRDGVIQEIPAEELVRGDVVELEVGDLVPADLRLLAAEEIAVDEAALTGESLPVIRDAGDHVRHGTHLVSGHGTGVVVATGRATELGRIASLLVRKADETEFQQGLRRFSGFLVQVVLALTVFVTLANAGLGRGWLDALLFALALAVGITPEVLPAILTISLARGARRMARDEVVVKRLMSVEDLGNIDVLCCDKTGTLTAGEFALRDFVNVEGEPDLAVLARAAAVGSVGTGPPAAPAATPVDQATWQCPALKDALPLLHQWQVLDRVAFDFHRRRAGALVADAGRRRLFVQGAPESVLAVCDTVARGARRPVLDAATRAALAAEVAGREAEGMRVLAVAERELVGDMATPADEAGLTLCGFLVYLDPPKAEAPAALGRLAGLGVEVKVLTGDSAVIARRICREVGLPEAPLMTGEEVGRLDDRTLRAEVARHSVFARVLPEQKQRLVAALRSAGHVVGFLGDGVNDAPALRGSDVGIAVDTGTEVAKAAADIVLLRKSLAVLAGGIIEGRRTFANITKYILNTISANFGNMITVAVASLFLPFLPLLPSQILLCNFLSDLPLLMIATDRVDAEMLRRPRRWRIAPIARFMLAFGALSALFDLLLIGAVARWWPGNPALLRSAWFVESVCSEILVTFALRTAVPWFRSRVGSWLLVSSVVAALLGFAAPFSPIGRRYFGFTPLSLPLVGTVAGLLIAYFLSAELAKGPFFRRFGVTPPR